jgi:hypothetical protein
MLDFDIPSAQWQIKDNPMKKNVGSALSLKRASPKREQRLMH